MVDKPQKVASVMLIKKRISDFQGAAKSLIDKLSDHQKRLEKLEKDKDAVHLRRETMQAIGTLKKLDLLNKDLHDFKALVVPNDPNEAKSLLNMISTLETQIDDAKNSFSQYVDHGVLSNSVIPVDEQVPKSELNTIPNDNQTLINVQKQEDDLRTRKLMCESYLQLQRNLQDLNETFLSFTDLVRAQGETVDTIESNVENTLAEVNMGVAELSKAAKIKKAMIPVTCAMLSSCVGGPVGAIFGLKVAVGTALASAFLGYGGAKLIQKKTDTSSKETKED